MLGAAGSFTVPLGKEKSSSQIWAAMGVEENAIKKNIAVKNRAKLIKCYPEG